MLRKTPLVTVPTGLLRKVFKDWKTVWFKGAVASLSKFCYLLESSAVVTNSKIQELFFSKWICRFSKSGAAASRAGNSNHCAGAFPGDAGLLPAAVGVL